MKYWINTTLILLSFSLSNLCNSQEIADDVRCVGQTREGTPIRLSINLTERQLAFETNKWPILISRFSTNGILSVRSIDAPQYPGTYFVVAVKEQIGIFDLYRENQLKSRTTLICQDILTN